MRDRYSKEISMLYIEKNNVIRKPISMLLKKVVKKLYLASNENDGFYLFSKYRPSLVLIDISTNEINYIAILKQIREIDSEVSIIIISAHNENKLILKCLEFNIHNYIKRPINKNFLLKSIENNAKMIYVNKINKYQQNEIITQKILLQNIIDSQKEMIIVTDFKEISFMNDSFLNFFKISNSEEFKKKYNSIIDVFCEFENYINTKYLEKDKITNNINLGKEFFKLVNNTDESKRIVIICNTKLEEKSFYINISSIDSKKGLYLIGLMDITKITIDKLQIENIAYTDGLTGVANRNKFELTFEDELSRTKRYKNPLSIAILDIDNFKNFNDKYGHLIGDEVLIMIAKECELQLRASDTFARWGGEEFILILPQTKLERAIIVIEKIRNIIKNKKHKTAGFITCSFGVTEYKEKDNLKSIFKRCDKALYQAKFNGRDRVEYIK